MVVNYLLLTFKKHDICVYREVKPLGYVEVKSSIERCTANDAVTLGMNYCYRCSPHRLSDCTEAICFL